MILSIENHLSMEQQDTMAVMMKEIFGGLLYTEKVASYNVLKSPSDIRDGTLSYDLNLPMQSSKF